MTAAAIRDAIQGGKVLHRFAPIGAAEVGVDDCEVTICTSSLALDEDVWVMEGIDLSRFEAHPVVLRDHDMTQPVARASNLVVTPQRITARASFAPIGVSTKADETRGLVKSGIITGVSSGIIPLESEPLNPRNPRGGQRITKSILVEFSFVSVPSDTASAVTARARGGNAVADKQDWKVGAARNLPIEDGDAAWDGPAAEAQIFEHAGGDDFDPTEARKGFLVYDAEAPEARGSYKLPIARMVDGQLVVPKSAIRAAASRLPDTDVPDDVKTDAAAVLDSYKEKAGMTDDSARAAPRKTGRRFAKRKVVFQRGLIEVANLCWIFEELGWQLDVAKWEAAIENDASKVPAMLAAVLHDLGDVILAMTAEELAEALTDVDVEPELDDAELLDADRAHVLAAPTSAVRSFRLGLVLAKQRAGKKLSTETVRCLRAAQDKHAEAIDIHRRAIATHKEAMDTVEDLLDDADPEAPVDDAGADTADEANRARRARAHQLKAKAANLAA